MTTSAQTSAQSKFCSVCARQAGLDPVGYAHAYTHVVAVEIALPWPASMYDEPGTFPQELLDLRQRAVEAYQQGKPFTVGALAIAPDKAYSQPGYRRALSYRRPSGSFAKFEREEYLVPEAMIGPLCWALLVEHAMLPVFDVYRQPPAATRDLMVCTHGTIDAACAKFGIPLYRQLRRMADQSGGRYRAWRVSHFGGHVFAPTLLDMPEFRYWAYVEPDKAGPLAEHVGDAMDLRECYRGWAGFDSPFLQAAERDLFVRHGWSWLDYLKTGSLLEHEACYVGDPDATEPTCAEVRIDYTAPDGHEHGVYVAHVEAAQQVECIYSTAEQETYSYPQYTVTRIERVE